MTIFLYKGLTRNPEIRNTPIWVLPNTWRLGQARDTKFDTNVSNEILLNPAKTKITGITIFELLRENQQGGGDYRPLLFDFKVLFTSKNF